MKVILFVVFSFFCISLLAQEKAVSEWENEIGRCSKLVERTKSINWEDQSEVLIDLNLVLLKTCAFIPNGIRRQTNEMVNRNNITKARAKKTLEEVVIPAEELYSKLQRAFRRVRTK
jgi:hypothetical protein